MTRLDESIQLQDGLRCPQCGKRIDAEAEICAACGNELLVRKPRMHCARCGNRILAEVDVCPRCGGDPRAQRFPYLKRIVLALVAVLLIACVGWVLFRALATDAAVRAFGFIKPVAPTQVVQIIYIVATPVRPTPTLTPTSVPTPTSRFTPSPTKKSAKAVTPTIPTPILGMYPAPQLIAPLNAMIYTGTDYTIALEWQSVATSGLRENEWYAITIQYTGRDNYPAEQKRYSKETRWGVPNEWSKDISSDARTFRWNVIVVRVDGVDPFTALNKTLASPASITRTFIWK